MLASKFFIVTSKDDPKDAVLRSHQLLLRAGYIKQDSSGVFSFLPLGFKVLKKIENIVREEFIRSGYAEILTPFLQTREIWETSNRWQRFGPEMFKLTDRHEREFCLPPTAEEAFTSLVKELAQSKKNFPVNLFQIHMKFRDEIRPRFGLIRSREFLMADGYSFSLNEEGLDEIYQITYELYERIFQRLSLTYCAVLADTGVMGGNFTHQFMALANTGESFILTCPCGYAADQETAKSFIQENKEFSDLKIKEIHTPNVSTISDLAAFLKKPESDFAKIVTYFNEVDKSLVSVIVRGDREVNPISIVHKLGIAEHEFRFASDEELKAHHLVKGFIGPIGLDHLLLVDEEVATAKSLITGANKKDYHFENVVYNCDFKGEVGHYHLVADGEICPCCKKERLTLMKGTEVGQVFKLGTKYSEAFNLGFSDEDGFKYVEVGCYGVGISRSLQAIVEEHNDEYGIRWPLEIAPFKLVIIPTNYSDLTIKTLADELYNYYVSKTDVLLDDRAYNPGFKFKDAELIGIPYHVIVGKKAGDKVVEVKNRYTMEKVEMSISDLEAYLRDNHVINS